MQIICKFEVSGEIVKWFLEEWIYYYPIEDFLIESYMYYFHLIDLISVVLFEQQKLSLNFAKVKYLKGWGKRINLSANYFFMTKNILETDEYSNRTFLFDLHFIGYLYK